MIVELAHIKIAMPIIFARADDGVRLLKGVDNFWLNDLGSGYFAACGNDGGLKTFRIAACYSPLYFKKRIDGDRQMRRFSDDRRAR